MGVAIQYEYEKLCRLGIPTNDVKQLHRHLLNVYIIYIKNVSELWIENKNNIKKRKKTLNYHT